MTNITNEQLEAWAGLGPWCQPDGPEYGVMLDRVPSRPIHGFLGQPIFDKQPHDDWFEQEMINAALIAAAPALASALLAERKAREVEVGELRAAIQDIAENWKWWDEDRYDRCSSVVGDSIAEAEQALKEINDESGWQAHNGEGFPILSAQGDGYVDVKARNGKISLKIYYEHLEWGWPSYASERDIVCWRPHKTKGPTP